MNEGDRDAPSEFELMAYVDGELDPVQRLEIEDRLAGDPELAAQVMADMRARDALLLVGNARRSPLPSSRTMNAARRLEGALGRQKSLRIMRWPFAFAAFAGIGWLAHGPVTPRANGNSPPVVSDGGFAHRTGSLRTRMRQHGRAATSGGLKAGAATRLRYPALPEGLKATDVLRGGSPGPSPEAVQPRQFQPA